jgi:hypothetical protein
MSRWDDYTDHPVITSEVVGDTDTVLVKNVSDTTQNVSGSVNEMLLPILREAVNRVYWVDPSETDQGATGSGKTIKAYVDSIGSTKNATIVLMHDQSANTTAYTLTTSEEITSNITFAPQNGAIIDGAGTLTISGPFEAGLYQVFGSSITVVFGFTPGLTINTVWFTGAPDGSTDNTAAFQSAHDSCPTGSWPYGGARLYTPAHASAYIVSALDVYLPVTWYGDGHSTIIKAKSDASSYLIHVNGGHGSAITNREGYLYGVTIRDMFLYGNERTPTTGAMKFSTIDHSLFENLWIERFKGPSLNLYTAVRESTFRNIHTRWNGNDASGEPDIWIKEQVAASTDSHNGNTFDEIYSVYTMGDRIIIDSDDNSSDGTEYVRNNKFSRLFIHGIQDSQDGSGNNPFNATFTAGEKAGKHVWIGTGKYNTFDNCHFLQMGNDVPGFEMDSGGNGDPGYNSIANSMFVGRYLGTNNAAERIIFLQKGSLLLSNNGIFGRAGTSNENVAIESGTLLYGWQTNHVEGTGPVLEGGTRWAVWDKDQLFYCRQTDLYDLGDVHCGTTDNISYMSMKTKTTLLDLSVSTVWTGAITQGSVVFGVTARNVTAITGGATSIDIGENGGGADADLFIDGMDVAINTTATPLDSNAAFTGPKLYQANQNLGVTGVGGAATGGTIRIQVHFMQMVPPSS